MKRLLAVIVATSAVVLAGALASAAVMGITEDAHKTGTYSPVDMKNPGSTTSRGVPGNSTLNKGKTEGPSGPGLITGGGSASPTGRAPSDNENNPSTVGNSSGSGSTASPGGGAPQVTPITGPEAPSTTTTSFDDSGNDDDLIDD